MNNKKLPYQDADLEIVLFSSEDIVTTSPNVDNKAWDANAVSEGEDW